MRTNQQTVKSSPELALKVQTWGDDLRLPCVIDPAAVTDLLAELEPLRRPSIPFQSKHLPALKRNKWFTMRRPADRSRTGLLVIWPAHSCCIYISGDPVNNKRPSPRVALLRLRVDPQFFVQGLTVFAATLSPVARRLWIEDTLIWKGRSLLGSESFTARWKMANQWIEHYCILDPRLLGGLEVEMMKWRPLSQLNPEGIWELVSDDVGGRRYLWIANYSDEVPKVEQGSAISHSKADAISHRKTGAIAHREAGVEQWNLTGTDGAALGRALIRTLVVSERLRLSSSNTVRVEIIWNEVFKKWEIVLAA